ALPISSSPAARSPSAPSSRSRSTAAPKPRCSKLPARSAAELRQRALGRDAPPARLEQLAHQRLLGVRQLDAERAHAAPAAHGEELPRLLLGEPIESLARLDLGDHALGLVLVHGGEDALADAERGARHVRLLVRFGKRESELAETGCGHGSSAWASRRTCFTGSRTTNSVPRPNSLCTEICPPCPSTI